MRAANSDAYFGVFLSFLKTTSITIAQNKKHRLMSGMKKSGVSGTTSIALRGQMINAGTATHMPMASDFQKKTPAHPIEQRRR